MPGGIRTRADNKRPGRHSDGVAAWAVARVIHFAPGAFVNDGLAHFGFHGRSGRYYAIDHRRHFLGLVGADGRPEWTVAAEPVFPAVPNISAALAFPMYVDTLPDGTLLVSNFGNARLYRIDVAHMAATLLVEGHGLGLVDMGNSVVDQEGSIWVNEVTGCRVWRFDQDGNVLTVLGNGTPGFQISSATFEEVRFSWIYDLRPGPGDRLYVLDSRNFALRVIDIERGRVETIAGTGQPGYAGDGGNAREATFGGDPAAKFDGPISLALDEAGNAYIGDRHNHVVRMIERANGTITTIAGRPTADDDLPNDPRESDPLRLNLPQISSLDYWDGRLFVPTDLRGEVGGDLVVLRRRT